jgi:deazaflavin-dependent oxidoreductase (nitroreductase family)
MRRCALLAVSVALLSASCIEAAPRGADVIDANRSTLELTTVGRKSGKPHTATVWFVYEDGAHCLYVQSGKGGETDWYLNLLKTAAVTVKIGDRRLRGHAAAIDDAAETARVHDLFKRKYLTARIMSWFGGGFGAGKVVRIDHLEPTA